LEHPTMSSQKKTSSRGKKSGDDPQEMSRDNDLFRHL
jgi:hypothetical protein